MIYDVIIIGAGAAGLFCGSAPDWARGGVSNQEITNIPIGDTGRFDRPSATEKCAFRGLVLEKGKRPGRKLLMSGSGQCNITHAGSMKDFIGCYGGFPLFGDVQRKPPKSADHTAVRKKHSSLLRNCLYKYNNLSLMDFLESGGVKTAVREDGKVFPASMDAHDVLELLLRKTAENGFEIRYGSGVERIEAMPRHLWKVHTTGDTYATRTIIIATGGCSYPTTGSDGSMFPILERDLGIAVTPLKPALSSIQVCDYPYGALSGISFEASGISIWRDGRKIAQNTGALLFTHQDLSGPAILNISKFAEAGDVLKINYVAPLNYNDVLSRLKSATHGSRSGFAGIIAAEFHLPLRFCKELIGQCGESLKLWARLLTGQELTVSSTSGFNKAMATSGGVELSQVDMTTMELKAHPGIYIIGEALDVDGITGGYNLQFAYSSGRVAVYSIISR